MTNYLTSRNIETMNLAKHSFSEYRFSKGNLKDGDTFFHALEGGDFDMVEFVEFTDESGILGRWNSITDPGRSYSILTRLACNSLFTFGRQA